jgi:pimeloyl-ACP methyl ester carboxylesterase
VKCAKGVISPCPQADGDRACGASNAAYDEYQALVSLPNFQKGFPQGEPYLAPTDGGDIDLQSPAPREEVCLGLTIPKGVVMPAAGWPVVIFAHGTGGSFRSHMSSTTAGVLSTCPTPFAVLGIDQVEHGPRRGKSQESPNNLFFNFTNPKAARGNPLQGAADQLSLVRLASSFDLTAQQSGGDAIKFDPLSITFFGHSQGSTEGSLAMPYADGVKAVVLSGNGASLKFALLNKTSPVNVSQALPLLLQDASLGVPGVLPEMHPVLSILQQWIDPADPLNFARAITRVPETGHTAKNVFQTYGLGDTYAPPITLREYVIAGQFDLVAKDPSATKPDDIQGLKAQPVGASGNVSVANVKYTLGVREYGPVKGADGHFVAFSVPSANSDVVRFLSSSVSSTAAPPIGAP